MISKFAVKRSAFEALGTFNQWHKIKLQIT